MADAAAVKAMEALHSCRCCLRRPPDKGLKTLYENVGKTENYWDMLKECFNIHLNVGNDECGICEVCVARLRDATEFKIQVQQSQVELKALLEKALQEKDKKPSLIKVELVEEDPNVEEVMIQDDGPVKSELGDGDIVSSEISNGESSDAESGTSESEDNNPPFKCQECPKTFDNEDSAIKHMIVHAKEFETHMCNVCSEIFERYADLSKHMDIHEGLRCSVCKKVLANEDSLRVHMRTHTGEKPYSCEICDRKFGHKHHMKRHMQSHKDIFSCQVCSKKFAEQSQLKEHELVHTEIRTDSCENTCNISGPQAQKTDLTKHMQIHNQLVTESGLRVKILTKETSVKEKRFSCEVCNKQFGLKHHLTRHMKGHPEYQRSKELTEQSHLKKQALEDMEEHNKTNELWCGLCKKVLATKYSFKVHMSIHTGEKPYSCEVCSMKFAQKHHLKRHHMRTHKGEYLFSCQICPKKFTDQTVLKNHELVHAGKKNCKCGTCKKGFCCEMCGKCFRYKNNFIFHMNGHMGIKPYFCDTCNKRFTNKNALKSHKRTHTDEKSFPCDICSKRFRMKDTLKSHMIIHTGLKPFSCEICKRQFSFKNALRVHMKFHSGIKPHVCNICRKAFTLQSTLRRHILSHTGEKPFPCHVCGKAFVTKYQLNKHLLIHNRNC